MQSTPLRLAALVASCALSCATVPPPPVLQSTLNAPPQSRLGDVILSFQRGSSLNGVVEVWFRVTNAAKTPLRIDLRQWALRLPDGRQMPSDPADPATQAPIDLDLSEARDVHLRFTVLGTDALALRTMDLVVAGVLGVADLRTPAGIATAGAPEKRQALALVTVDRGDGFTDPQIRTIEELILGALDRSGRFRVIGQSEINTVLSVEARKQIVGSVDNDWTVKVANALGADLVATGSVGRLGTATVVSLKVIDVRSVQVIARAEQTIGKDEALPEATQQLAAQIVKALWPASRTSSDGPPPPPLAATRPLGTIPLETVEFVPAHQ